MHTPVPTPNLKKQNSDCYSHTAKVTPKRIDNSSSTVGKASLGPNSCSSAGKRKL